MEASCSVTLSRELPQRSMHLHACPLGRLLAGSSPVGAVLAFTHPCFWGGHATLGSTGHAEPSPLSLEMREQEMEHKVPSILQLPHTTVRALLLPLCLHLDQSLPPQWRACPSQSGRLFYFYGNISPETLQSEPGAVRNEEGSVPHFVPCERLR